MRIEFLTQEDSIYVLPLLEEFLRCHSSQVEVVRISCCAAMGNRPRLQLLHELFRLYKLTGFVRLLCRFGISRMVAMLPFSQGASRYFSASQLCRAYGVEYAAIQNPNRAEFISEVIGRNCDLIVSVACPYILKNKLLSLPRLGCINIHHAPLPRYKGMMPTFWQLYHGEKSVGLTIHYMTEKLDDGEALLQEHLDVEPGESLDHLIRRSKRHAAHCLSRVLGALETNSVTPVSLHEETGSYFTFPTLSQIREFHRRGLRAL
jgi:methionyl-tRNA formyltransferase